MNKRNYLSRSVKYIHGECSWAEAILLKISLLFSSEAREYNKWLKEMKAFRMNAKYNYTRFDVENAWNKVYNRIVAEHPKLQEDRFPLTYVKVAGVAAAIGFLIVLSIYSWFYFNPETVRLTNYTQAHTIISTLPDGTQVFLSQNTLLEYPKRFRGKTRKVRLEGEAYFDVAKNPSKHFIIETSSANIEVVGTAFNLKTTNRSVMLNVTEGKVKISLASSDKSELIVAGEAALAKGNEITKYQHITSPTVKKRMRILVFQDETLDDIVKVISKTYGVRIYLQGDDLKAMRISVTFDNELSSIIGVLSASFNLKVTNNSDGSITLSK